MECEENERIYTIFKIIATSLIYSIIGFFTLFFIGALKVDALPAYRFNTTSLNEDTYSALNLRPITRGYFRGCTSTTSCFNTSNGSNIFWGILSNTNTTANDSNGLMWYVMPSDITIRSGQIYSTTALYCGNSKGSPTITMWNGNGYSSSSEIEQANTIYATFKNTDDVDLRYNETNYSCMYLYTIWKATKSGAVIGIQAKVSSATQSVIHYLVGYNITELSPLDYVTVSAFNSGVTSINNNTNTKIASVITEIQSTKTAILNQMNANTESTNNAINEASQNEIASQQVCKNIKYTFNAERYNNNTDDTIGYISQNSGTITSNENWKVSDYIELNKDETYTLTGTSTWNYPRYCLYSESGVVLSCTQYATGNNSFTITPTQNGYIRVSYSKEANFQMELNGKVCQNGNQAIAEQNEEIAKNQKETNDLIKSGDIDTDDIDNTLDVDIDDHGLTAVITAPLNAINGILSDTCSDLVVPIPFINNNLTLPCFTPIYESNFPTILAIWQTVVTGLIAYWICTSIFGMVHGFTDPTEDRIEVLDL